MIRPLQQINPIYKPIMTTSGDFDPRFTPTRAKNCLSEPQIGAGTIGAKIAGRHVQSGGGFPHR